MPYGAYGLGGSVVICYSLPLLLRHQNSRNGSVEERMGANRSGERRKLRMKRSKRNLVTQEKADAAAPKKSKKKKA